MSDPDDDWMLGYFDDPYTEFHPFPDDATTDAEVEALVQLIPSPPARILDVGCGPGRHAVRLSRRGFDVVGIDTSPGFLHTARASAAAANADATFVESDMRELDFDQEFDGALSLFTAWGYFDDEQNQQVLDRIARSLRVGGRLVLDLIHRDYLLSVYEPKDWQELNDGSFAISNRTFDPVTGVNVVRHRWRTASGELHERHHELRIYTPTELRHMLRCAGLEPIHWYGGFSLEPFGLHSRRMLVVAERSL